MIHKINQLINANLIQLNVLEVNSIVIVAFVPLFNTQRASFSPQSDTEIFVNVPESEPIPKC